MIRSRSAARLVHIGSAAEYGRSETGVPVTESAPPQPASVYGVTKLAGTRLVELARAAGLDAVVLRVFNVVGAGAPEDGLPGRAAMQLRQAMASGADVRLGPLDAVRDFVDARDVADAVLAAATAPALPHSVINVGSGQATGLPHPGQEADRGQRVRRLPCTRTRQGSARSADLPWMQADIGRARQDLGWQPSRDLKASVSRPVGGKLWRDRKITASAPDPPPRLVVPGLLSSRHSPRPVGMAGRACPRGYGW